MSLEFLQRKAIGFVIFQMHWIACREADRMSVIIVHLAAIPVLRSFGSE